MKNTIHPKYFETTVTCAGCGHAFTTGSTVHSMKVDICSNCHPFFTGQKKLIDTEGRVEKFERRKQQGKQERRPQKATPQPVFAKTAPTSTATAAQPKPTDQPRSLRDMLQDAANSG